MCAAVCPGTPARSGSIAGIPAPGAPFLPPRRRCTPAAFRPPLVFLAGGSCALRAQQFPARANAFLYSPITGPSCHLPTLLLDAAALHCSFHITPLPSQPPPQSPQPGPPRSFWEAEQSLEMRHAEVAILPQFWSAKGGDVCPHLPCWGAGQAPVGSW